MICYRDRTFCNLPCAKKDRCRDALTPEVWQAAEAIGLPISQAVYDDPLDYPKCFEPANAQSC
jgi:hypothetical protein